MQCQQCHAELFPGARFCHACAWEVHPQCSSCRTVNPPGSNFCFSCGGSLTPESPSSGQTSVPPSTLVCPRCHQSNEPSSTYCYACGLPLEGAASSALSETGSIRAFAMGSPGGFWVRTLAYLIDGVVLVIAFSIVWPLVSGESFTEYWSEAEPNQSQLSNEDFWSESGLSWGDLFSWGMDLVYYTGAVGVWATTLGKRPFRLYVVRSDGSKVGLGRAMARYLAYFLSAIILGIGFFMIAFRADKRGLHDLICDTVVIRRSG